MNNGRTSFRSVLLATFGALMLSSGAALADPSKFFLATNFKGCYSQLYSSSTSSYVDMGYTHWIGCHVDDSSCHWSSAYTQDCGGGLGGAYERCCMGVNGAWSYPIHTSITPFKTVDVHSSQQGDVCVCSDLSDGHSSVPRSCITLSSKWVDLSGWPRDFRYAIYREGGCLPSEEISNYDVNMYPYRQITIDDAANDGYVELMANAYAGLVFTEDGDLVLAKKKDNFYNETAWHSDTAGRGYKVEFQNDGNLCIRDANVQILWCSNTYAGGGPTGKKGVNLRIQENCNLTMWAADGTLVWTTDTPFCSNPM